MPARLEQVLALNLAKEVRKDTRVIQAAVAPGASLDLLLQETKEIDREFLGRVAHFPVRVVVRYEEIEPVRRRRIERLFAAAQRVLSAWADLRVAESVAGLPLEVHAEPHVVTIRNTTAVTVPSFSADTEPASLAQVSERVRAAIKANVFPEGLSVVVRGKKTPEQVRVAAPLLVRGALVLDRMRVPFSARLDGLRRSELRLEVDRPYELELEARPADIEPPPAARNARELLEQTIWLELTYARKRQFDQFLASPDQTGPSSATYVYRTAQRPFIGLESKSGVRPGEEEDHTLGWIVLGLLLAASLPAAAVVWARS